MGEEEVKLKYIDEKDIKLYLDNDCFCRIDNPLNYPPSKVILKGEIGTLFDERIIVISKEEKNKQKYNKMIELITNNIISQDMVLEKYGKNSVRLIEIYNYINKIKHTNEGRKHNEPEATLETINLYIIEVMDLCKDLINELNAIKETTEIMKTYYANFKEDKGDALISAEPVKEEKKNG